MITSLVFLFLLALATTLLAMSRKRIPEGQVYTLHRRRGQEIALLKAGTHWIVPLRDHVAHKISLTGRTLQLDDPLRENNGRVRGTVYWQVLDPERAETMIDQAEAMIRRRALESLHDEGPDDDTIRNTRVKNHLNGILRPSGILVTRLNLRTLAS